MRKDLPAQVSFRLISRLDDFLEQNPIDFTTKHWHILSVRGTESPRRANFTFPTAVVAAGEKTTDIPLDLSLSLALARSFLLESSGYRSTLGYLAHFFPRFLSRPAVDSLASFTLVARHSALLSGGGRGGQTTRVLTNSSPTRGMHRSTYITPIIRHFRLTPCLATTPFSFTSKQTPATRTEDSSTRQPHAPRGAHTQRPNAFVMAIFGGKQLRAPTAPRGSLRRPASGA